MKRHREEEGQEGGKCYKGRSRRERSWWTEGRSSKKGREMKKKNSNKRKEYGL